jgi:glyoxylase-like metal-dependent hydrolase (beta-lactamase superfamily II)
MTRSRLALLLTGLLISAAVFHAQTPRAEQAYTFTQIVPGIYSALGTGTMNVGSNSAVIVNQDDVVIVDSHISPESGRAMLSELKAITDKPVKFLINTHFHYDHTNGNQVFPPAVDIIGHEYTRRRLAGDILQKGMFANLLTALPQQLDALRMRAAGEQDPAAKARLEQQLRVQTAFAQSVKEVTPTPPNLTLDDHMTLFRGGREIRLLYLGRGHTGGDIVVYLPKERVLCSGDLLVNGVANLVDGYVNEWPAALDKLKALDFDNVIPGHGEPFRGKERVADFQAYLADFWQQASTLHDAHVSAEDAAKRIDMSAHKLHYPSITGPGVPLAGVTRVYEVIEHRADN